ncbi:ATP-binding cassette domain-containing protein, partial [Streptomyces lasiicapitis]
MTGPTTGADAARATDAAAEAAAEAAPTPAAEGTTEAEAEAASAAPRVSVTEALPAADTASAPPVLSVRGLSVRFRMRGGAHVAAVTDARFDLAAGECLALVGESGCGKSVLASALLGLLPENAE